LTHFHILPGLVVQWIEYLPAGRQGSFLNFRYTCPTDLSGRGPIPVGVKAKGIMITVYAILSEMNGYIYVGMAKDAEKRLKEHNAGKSRYTRGLRPWKNLYRELQPDWKTARKREIYLKSGIGKEFLKSLAS
jgi:putative endonuclease